MSDFEVAICRLLVNLMANDAGLITGAGGFLGVCLSAAVVRRCVAQLFAPTSAECDLTDPSAARALFTAIRPSLVIHPAARVGGIGANRKHPGTFFRDNMMMGMNVLEAARLAGTKKVVMIATICSYPKYARVPFREEDLWNGYPEETNAPYGIAKKALYVMANAYRQEFGCNIITLFPVNLYGPGDNFDLESSHVIPAMIRKMIDAQDEGRGTVELWGDGTATREFLYVDDAARGICDAAERYDEPDPVNLGAGFEISMRELAAKIAGATGYRGRIAWDSSKPNGQPRRMLDVSRARERFGFVATTPLDEGLATTIAWYRENRERIRSKDIERAGRQPAVAAE